MVLRSAYYFFKLAQHGATEITTILKLVKIEIEKKKKKISPSSGLRPLFRAETKQRQ